MSTKNSSQQAHTTSEAAKGSAAAAVAFAIWGILPIYWHIMAHMPSIQILLHRILWSFVFLFVLSWQGKQWQKTLQIAKQPKVFWNSLLSGALLTGNWLIYIWAVTHNFVVEASLGYFITPLLNVLLGVVFFKDRPRRLQWLAIILAIIGVIYQLIALGKLPWIALVLATTFGLYGMLRKKSAMESLPGLLLETSIFSVPALLIIIWLEANGSGIFLDSSTFDKTILMSTGCITSIPLILFGYGARRINMISLGLLQYLTPVLLLIIGIFIFDEDLNFHQTVSFICIWCALLIYSYDGLRVYHANKIT